MKRREFFAATVGLTGALGAKPAQGIFHLYPEESPLSAFLQGVVMPPTPRLHYRSEHADLIDRLLTYNLDLPEMHRQQRLHYSTTALEEMS
jgi:hypothetical protein